MRGLGVAIAVGTLVLAGCGHSGGGGSTGTAAGPTTTRVEVLKQLPPAERTSGTFDPSAIYTRESPGVVTVISTGLDSGGDEGLGSGFVISATGEIATNAHVVTSGEGKDIRKAGQVFVRFKDGNQVPAKVIGFDPFADVALLKVDPRGLTLRPLPLGDDRTARVGAPVAAIGSPFGEEQSLSVGVVSALGRSIQSLTGFKTPGAVQTDAAINHGNSGGPLLDAAGRVIGINSQIQTSSGDGSGVGFAVPVDTVKRSLAQLRTSGHARYAYLGVQTAMVYPQLAQRFGLRADHGAWVQSISPGGPAAAAGLRGGSDKQPFQDMTYDVGGDVITAVAGKTVRTDEDLARWLAAYRPGHQVTLTVVRDGRSRSVRVRLGDRPLDAPQ